MYSIGDLATRTGVKVPTIRYYEQMGLLPSDGRTTGNQRRYSRVGLARLSFIRHARDLGLSIGAIRALVALEGKDCGSVHAIAASHLTDIRTRIAALQRLEAELTRIATACDGGASPCRTLAALADHRLCDGEHLPA